MPYSAGPNIAARPNLVFEYDTGDVQNSYKGEPTTNISNGLEGHGGSWTLQSQTYNGAPIYRNIVTAPSTFNNFGFRSNTQVNLNQSGPKYLTISFYANVLVSPGALYGYITVAFTDSSQETYGWTYVPSNWATTNIGQWQFVKATVALNPAKTPQNTVVWYVYRDNATEGTVDFAAIQLEQKDHPTPFVAMGTSRSNTQGLLDISGRSNTISLANMSFNSSAQMIFDGASNYIPVSNYTSSNNAQMTIDIWTKPNSTTQTTTLISKWGASGLGNFSWLLFLNWFAQGNLYFLVGNSSGNNYSTSTMAHNLSTSAYSNFTITYSSGNINMYRNGTLVTTGTSPYTTLKSVTTPLTVGADWDAGSLDSLTRPYNGIIPSSKIYSSALSSTQVLQNYNQLKSRFNLT